MNSASRLVLGVLVPQVGSHHSALSTASLAESFGMDSVQTGRSHIQIIHGTALTYLANKLFQPADLRMRTRL